MNSSTGSYCLRWRNDLPRRIWYIFGLDTKGEYWGEIREFVGESGSFHDITGCLAPEETTEVLHLIERIRARPDRLANTIDTCGVLADGPRSNPTIIYRPSPSAKNSSDADFLRIAEIIEVNYSKTQRRSPD
jgi:hypothetical protein